jgi:hypothetical protein
MAGDVGSVRGRREPLEACHRPKCNRITRRLDSRNAVLPDGPGLTGHHVDRSRLCFEREPLPFFANLPVRIMSLVGIVSDDATKLAQALIDSVDHSPAPKARAGQPELHHDPESLEERHAAPGAQKHIAFCVDIDIQILESAKPDLAASIV